MNVYSAYSEWSQSYDTDRNWTRDLDQQVTQASLSNQHYDTVLELGCGTGKNTAFYAQIARTVYAVDFSEAMMAQAVAKCTSPNVCFIQANLLAKLPIQTASVHLATCNLVLEHIPDLLPIFQEISRVLVQGGKLWVSELHPFKQYQGKKAHYQQDGELVEVDGFIHHLSEFWDTGNLVGLSVTTIKEFWHENDQSKPPRLIALLFEKADNLSLTAQLK